MSAAMEALVLSRPNNPLEYLEKYFRELSGRETVEHRLHVVLYGPPRCGADRIALALATAL